MRAKNRRKFEPRAFLATIGTGRKILAFEKGQNIFAQGGAADAVFYVQKGKIKLTVVSEAGKEATVGILGGRQFFRRRRPGRPGISNGLGLGHDGVHDSSNR